jgi:hypothetical protein
MLVSSTNTSSTSLATTTTAHSATISNATPIPAPYRQPTMQDLPLIKPPPRAAGSGSFGKPALHLSAASFHPTPSCPSFHPYIPFDHTEHNKLCIFLCQLPEKGDGG